MSASSRSSAARGADIIDLDRYMRAAVRPPRPARRSSAREQLVVDSGGVGRAPPRPRSGDSDTSVSLAPLAPPTPPAPPASPRRRAGPPAPPARRAAHAKRFSHDSGLSDSSYARRRQKSHRRGAEPPHASPAPPAAPPLQFQLACERALRDQQQQLARVAQLCERLAAARAGPSSSDSSSSRTTDARRKDQRRAESCKTYHIIMSKLDELGRLFATRRPPSPARSPRSPHAPHAPHAPPRRAASSRSVSVCDKLVATEGPARGAAPGAQPAQKSARARRLRVTHAPALDIAPAELLRCCGGDGSGAPRPAEQRLRSSRPSPPHAYHLDDPVHLYEQSKHVRAVRASARARGDDAQGSVAEESVSQVSAAGRSASAARAEYDERVCAACRGAWRAFWRRLPQLFAVAR